MDKLSTLLACLPPSDFKNIFTQEIATLRAKVAELEDIANDYKQQISDQAIEIDDNQDYMKAQQSLISDQKNAIQALEAQLAKYENLEPVAWVCVNEDGECEQIDYGSESPLPGDDGFIPLYALEK